MKLGLAKDILMLVMKRYTPVVDGCGSLGKVFPTKEGIRYGKSGLVPNSDIIRIVEDLYGNG